MSFQLSKSQKEIQKAAMAFAKGVFDKDLAFESEKKGRFPVDIRQKAAELGFIGIHYPEDYNGGDQGLFENVLVAEALCRKDSSMGIALMLSGFSAECLFRYGPAEGGNKWLPLIVEGRVLAGAAFAENDAGWNPAVIATTVREEEEEWVVSGYKTHVPNGDKAAFYCVSCRMDMDKEDDLTPLPALILVEADREGVSIENRRDALGMRMTGAADIRFNNVRVPAENKIGRKGQGRNEIMGFYEEAWLLASAMALGTARGAFARALVHIKKRHQFGRAIASFQVIQHKIADMAAQLEGVAEFVYSSAASFDRGERSTAVAAMTKLSACTMALSVTSEAVQLLGGYGYMKEYEVERFYRDARALALFFGNSGFLKDVAAGSVIGKIK